MLGFSVLSFATRRLPAYDDSFQSGKLGSHEQILASTAGHEKAATDQSINIESEFLSNQSVLHQLMQVIHDRRDNPPAKSYTTTLFNGGVPKIGEKVTEEAGELVEAAGEYRADRDVPGDNNSGSNDEKRQHVVHEAADLMYHTMVMLSHCGLDLTDVEQELAGRFGVSGIDEKASRKK